MNEFAPKPYYEEHFQISKDFNNNVVVINTNSTNNIQINDSLVIINDINRTVTPNVTITRTLLDNQCLNFETDCVVDVSYKLSSGAMETLYHEINGASTTPFILPTGTNTFKY